MGRIRSGRPNGLPYAAQWPRCGIPSELIGGAQRLVDWTRRAASGRTASNRQSRQPSRVQNLGHSRPGASSQRRQSGLYTTYRTFAARIRQRRRPARVRLLKVFQRATNDNRRDIRRSRTVRCIFRLSVERR